MRTHLAASAAADYPLSVLNPSRAGALMSESRLSGGHANFGLAIPVTRNIARLLREKLLVLGRKLTKDAKGVMRGSVILLFNPAYIETLSVAFERIGSGIWRKWGE